MAGPCGTEAPAARWKRHIVRQLRQRDRTQKALFLELVPACECASGGGRGLGDGFGGDRAPGLCLVSPAATQAHQHLLTSKVLGLLHPHLLRPISD